jgi:hypothetical protein
VALVDAVALEDGSGGTELAAPRRARRHALVVFLFVSVITALGFRAHLRAGIFHGDALDLALPVFFWLVALLCWTVRRGRLRIEPEGVRWGYTWAGFRMRTERIGSVRVYDDGIALMPRRGVTPWHLSARDWEPWEDALRGLPRLGLAVERVKGPSPLRLRLQGYGLALDVLLVLDSIGATLLFMAA